MRWPRTREEWAIYKDYFGGILVGFAVWNLMVIPIIVFIFFLADDLPLHRSFISFSMVLLLIVSNMVAAGRLWKYMDLEVNRVYARRYCLTRGEITATLAVIILVLALLPGFDLDRYGISDDQGRYRIEDIMPAIPLIVAPWYIIHRGSYPMVPTMKRWLRHYLIPALLGMIGVASGYIMCGSSALAFLFLMISFFGSEGTAMYRFATEPCPWHLP